MFEHARLIVDEIDAGRPVALAVVISVSGSAPRPVGTSMVVTEAGRVLGSLSGGCVESAVVQVATEVVAGAPTSTEVFGYTDAEALSVGLMCGGAVEVIVLRIDAATSADVIDLFRVVADDREVDAAVAVRVAGAGLGTLTRETPAGARPTRIDGPAESRLVCPAPHAAPFLIYGGVDIAGPLAMLARMAGYRVTVCDARPVFADPARFPAAHEVVRAQPATHLREQPDDPTAVICVLTHEDRFDVPLLIEALGRRAAYVGAMGSRSTSLRRAQLLTDHGLGPTDLARLHAPIGLDLGGSSPDETALAIMGEVIASRNGRTGGQLRHGRGRLHAVPESERTGR